MSFKFSKTRGFTLIELMITLGIFVFMTALVLARYNSFYSGTVFTNLAYDVAMIIRQAQTYGISVKVSQNETNNSFNTAYGVRFGLDGDNTKQFSLNAYEKNVSGGFSQYETEQTYKIKQGARVSAIVLKSSPTAPDTVWDSRNHLEIIFQRPNPEPIFCINDNVNPAGSTCDLSMKYAKITLTAGDDSTTRTIEVNGVGQIIVK